MENKLILLFIMLFLSACSSSVEVTGDSFGGNTLCINGHLYYNSGYGKAPLFDYRTDTPVLIQCKKVNGVIEYEKEKVK